MGDQEDADQTAWQRREWPDYMRAVLEPAGITPYETVDSIRPKIEAIGFRIEAMREDWGGMLSTYPLYYTEVVDTRAARTFWVRAGRKRITPTHSHGQRPASCGRSSSTPAEERKTRNRPVS
jgi:hypothetical protein